MKLNVDTSIYVDSCAGATVDILRDANGSFVADKCVFYSYAVDAVIVKALAVKDGLHHANSLGINILKAESNSVEIFFRTRGRSVCRYIKIESKHNLQGFWVSATSRSPYPRCHLGTGYVGIILLRLPFPTFRHS